MKTTLGEINRLLDGRINGDAQLPITGAATLQDAGPNDISFAVDGKQIQRFPDCHAEALLVPFGLHLENKSTIQVADVENSFVQVAELFQPPVDRPQAGISPQAMVSPTAQIADDATVCAGAFVGANVEIGCRTIVFPNACIMEQCKLGNDVTVYPNAVLYERTVVGDRCIIHGGSVLGAFGFGYRTGNGRHELSAQLGNVVLGDEVEIGANTTIDRGTFGSTRVGDGTKIDDQVMIGHNCRIGKHNLLCSQVGIAGSCATGDYVVMAGQVGIGDHLNVGDRAVLGAKAGVMHDIPSGETFVGIPATPARAQMQLQAAKARLPEMRRDLKKLNRRLEQLEQYANRDRRVA